LAAARVHFDRWKEDNPVKPFSNMNELRGSSERVEVEWIDSSGTSGWHPESEALTDLQRPDHMLCCTIGYVIHEDSDKIVLTSSFAAQGAGMRDVGDVIAIPQFAIRDRRTLRR